MIKEYLHIQQKMVVPTKIRGGVSNLQKKEQEKYKKSNFHLTINTGQSYKDDDPHLDNDSRVFDATISDILHHIEDYVRIPDGHTWDDATIKDVDISYVIERGKQKHKLHCHILFKFVHRTKILLNYEKVKKKICDDLGLRDVYMYNRLVKATEDQNIMSYLSKYGE